MTAASTSSSRRSTPRSRRRLHDRRRGSRSSVAVRLQRPPGLHRGLRLAELHRDAVRSQEISADSTTARRRLDKRYGVARLTTHSGIRLLHVRRRRPGRRGLRRRRRPRARLPLSRRERPARPRGQDYSDDSLWAPVGGDPGRGVPVSSVRRARSTSTPRTTRTTRCGRRSAAGRDSVYQYMGEDGDARPRHPELHRPRLLEAGHRHRSSSRRASTSPSRRRRRSAASSSSTTCAATSSRTSTTRPSAPRASSITASEQAIIRALADSTASSSGGSSFTGQGTSLALNGVITTNRILSSANAYLEDSDVTVAGDFTVAASNLSQIDADDRERVLVRRELDELPARLQHDRLAADEPAVRGARRADRRPADPERRLRRPGAGRDDRAASSDSDVTAGGAIALSALSARDHLRARRQLARPPRRPRSSAPAA